MKEGDRKVDEGIAKFGKDINGWRIGSAPGDSAHYNGDWLLRAIAAKAGIYGNDAVEAMYPLTRVDGDGQTLDGSKNKYTLTFPPGQLPPVDAFWSLTMYDGKTQLLIENPINRYLINSPMLPGMPDGQAPSDPRMTHWRRPKTLASQLEQLRVKPADIKYIAVSHTHPDHIGNVELFPQTMLLVQKAEYEWPNPLGVGRFNPEHPVTKLEGDHDLFGDGSVTILATPGHTPGHQSLLVKLPKTGALVLSGDAVHFKSNWENRGVPSGNTDKDKTLASMQRISDVLAKEKAQLWINHDKAQRDSLKMAPAYYD